MHICKRIDYNRAPPPALTHTSTTAPARNLVKNKVYVQQWLPWQGTVYTVP
jgi:hypothetical protein